VTKIVCNVNSVPSIKSLLIQYSIYTHYKKPFEERICKYRRPSRPVLLEVSLLSLWYGNEDYISAWYGCTEQLLLVPATGLLGNAFFYIPINAVFTCISNNNGTRVNTFPIG